jgi:uncharacterized protein (DUF2236 family)
VRISSRRPTDRQRLQKAFDRVAALADIASPETRVERDVVPLSWTYNTPWHRPCVYVTTGMLDDVAPEELEAVVAHEITHIRNRDSLVMTLLSAPSTWILRGTRRSTCCRRARASRTAPHVCGPRTPGSRRGWPSSSGSSTSCRTPSSAL